MCAFLFAPLGIVFGHISLSQIKKTGEEGRGLAVAGLVISYLITVADDRGGGAERRCSSSWSPTTSSTLDGLTPDYPDITATPSPPGQQRCRRSTRRRRWAPTASIRPRRNRRASPSSRRRTAGSPTDPAVIRASITTSQGDVGLELDNGKTPCTVNNFTSLAKQGFFDNTTCHRLTTSAELGVLQCGDPTGTGTGGPGYRFPNEYPTNQYRMTDPALKKPVVYPRGTLAMANSGPGTNGSQFFLVYKDSQLPPTYTVFGTIDGTGLATLDKIAAGGCGRRQRRRQARDRT